ncbi:MAG: InlB B-repeat-containing protein [Clostridia bacterium]|nr:InlB B-repeat-containing protein [Clostridia bacterium]
MNYKSIAIDPNSTSVIYVGGAGNYFSTATGLLRSIDGGENWSVLTTSNNEKFPSIANNQGGYEVQTIRVDPKTGELWIASGCYGYEKIDPPYDKSLLNHEKNKEHTIKYVYNDKLVNEVTIRNNYPHNYIYDEQGLTLVDWYTDKEFKNSFSNGTNVYNSMVLYAKMEESKKIKFYDGEILLREIDLDRYDPADESQIPTREGYAFAGWYMDQNLTQLADFDNINTSTNVYAGWYKISKSVFNIEAKDAATDISYSNQKIQEINLVDNSTQTDNRSIYMSIDKDSTYLITFKMDTRFRIGMEKDKFYSYNVVKNYYIDEDDVNGRKSANKYVRKTISSGDNNKLLIYYYAQNGTKDFMSIKETFKIYKIEDLNLYR